MGGAGEAQHVMLATTTRTTRVAIDRGDDGDHGDEDDDTGDDDDSHENGIVGVACADDDASWVVQISIRHVYGHIYMTIYIVAALRELLLLSVLLLLD